MGGVVSVVPATADRFDDVSLVLGPKRPDATVCWCLSHRLSAKDNRALVGQARGQYVRQLCGGSISPGVLAYVDGQAAGWAAVGPRSQTTFARSPKIPHLDDLDVWAIWCVSVLARFRHHGLAVELIRGAASYARSQGAPAVEGYPTDNAGERVNTVMSYVGTKTMFEQAGFHQAAQTDSVAGGFPRVIMRLGFAAV
ncbi:MAG: GNAT family N-acetyltransferase [Propionibacteriaceae bacterium]|jgi:GNAT superfamily N-acetyltransferase|nr:GNAT family N-acetyltransferase [Propionibacteriaceae bacterium]